MGFALKYYRKMKACLCGCWCVRWVGVTRLTKVGKWKLVHCSLCFCICLKIIGIKIRSWVLFLKCFSIKYDKCTKKSMNHLKESIEIYSYVSTTQCKTWNITTSISPLWSLPEYLTLLPQKYPPFWIFWYLFIFLYIIFVLLFIHHSYIIYYLDFFLFQNLIQMEWCFMLTRFFNINFSFFFF